MCVGVGAENNKIKVFLFSAEATVRIILPASQVRGFPSVILEGNSHQHGVHCGIIYLSSLLWAEAFLLFLMCTCFSVSMKPEQD